MKRLRVYSLPFLFWIGLFVVVPTLILIVLSFSDLSLYDPGFFHLTLRNFEILAFDSTLDALGNSLKFAFLASVICFLVGYPVAYYLSTLNEKTRKILISLLIVPLWSNLLLRIYAWEKVFTPVSIISDLTGISLDLLGTDTAVVIGMVATYLPFMIFPIFSVLEKMDIKLIEASKDLGASDLQTFWRVVFPLSAGGVVSGFIMTLLPSMTSFVLPARLGLGEVNLIGNLIESKFKLEVLDLGGISINQGALISLLIMLFSVSAFVLIVKFDKEGETLL